jgi:hypothetical protein
VVAEEIRLAGFVLVQRELEKLPGRVSGLWACPVLG